MSHLLVLTTDEQTAGYRLAGAETIACADAAEVAERLLAALDGDRRHDVIAVHEPFHAALSPSLRRRLEETIPPLVLALPAGEGGRPDVDRRERLMQALWQAIGFEITFDTEGPT